MPRESAGLLMYRTTSGSIEALLVHPGGPFFENKDAGAWTIPKGEIDPEEDRLAAARREFEEELGFAPAGDFRPLGSIKQKGGKVVHAWAVEGDCDADAITSNTFLLEWPPRSGREVEFPEVDRAAWFSLAEARERINVAQVPFLDDLAASLGLDS